MAYLEYRGVLEGHKGWITNIATTWVAPQAGSPHVIASASRDNTIRVWNVDPEASAMQQGSAGTPVRCLSKHKQPVSDVVLSCYGDFLLSTSWDKTMRLWDVNAGESFRKFTGHTGDVNGGALSPDSRQVLSCSRDKTVRLWNTLGQQKYNFTEGGHTDWVSSVRFSPDTDRTLIVSCGWDRLAKVWDLKWGRLLYDFCGHTAPVTAVTISPDGSLSATAGLDGSAMLWDIVEGKHLYTLEANSPISSVAFSPAAYWLCAATESGIRVWDLEQKKPIADIRMTAKVGEAPVDIIDTRRSTKNKEVIPMHTFDEGHPRPSKFLPWINSIQWSPCGTYLYAGSTNGNIYVFSIRKN